MTSTDPRPSESIRVRLGPMSAIEIARDEGLQMNPSCVALQSSEKDLVTVASAIQAADITAGRFEDGREAVWMDRAIKAAFRIARITDETGQAARDLD